MDRKSFLGDAVTELVTYQWELPGVGSRRIGFGICEKSGLILQTTCVPPDEMLRYYEDTATYVNPDNAGKPANNKVADVQRQINFLKNSIGRLPYNALQIGSSDGYTLSQFRQAGVKEVLGVEPGRRAREFARTQYDIDSIPGSAESFDHYRRYDAIILTHILEHIYNPLQVLKRLTANLNEHGRLLIEVPLWERIELLRIGVLTFEHVNYFCESSLQQLLYQTGFEITDVGKHYHLNQYPVIIVVAKRSDTVTTPATNNYTANKNLLCQYIDKENQIWAEKKKRIFNNLNPNTATYIYGGGIHTCQLLSNTEIDKELSIAAIFDSSSSKWGKALGSHKIISPECLTSLEDGTNVVISSAFSEQSISQTINRINNRLNVIPLYPDDGITL